MSRTPGRLGWTLLWAVVYAHVGASIYYVPGILRVAVGDQAFVLVLLATAALGVLGVKEIETAGRFPGGGGAVSLVERAFGRWWGCLVAQVLTVNFFLAVAMAVTSAVQQIVVIAPIASPTAAALGCLAVLGVLNVVGLKVGRWVSLGLTGAALLVALLLVGLGVAWALGGGARPAEVWASAGVGVPALGGVGVAWLAVGGIQSFSLLAPAMRDLGGTPRRTMRAVLVAVLLTAPALTFLTAAHLPDGVGESALVTRLALLVGGTALAAAVALTGAGLLLFGANAAIVSGYHVSGALTARGLLPVGLGELSARFQTPSRAIALGVAVPAALVLAVGAEPERLAGIYASGVLGAAALGGVALDLLRWRERDRGLRFWLGAAVSVAAVAGLLALGWSRPVDVAVGAGMTVVGMLVAWATDSGWFVRALQRLPGFRLPQVVDGADVPFCTVSQARLRVSAGDPPGVLVASRGGSPKLYSEAIERARSRSAAKVFVLYVDEVPGLFYPELVSPTAEGLTVLESGCAMIRAGGLEPVPVWAISHSAAGSVAQTAEVCACDTVVIGATQRTFLWHALRGRFIQQLLKQLPPEIRLIVVG